MAGARLVRFNSNSTTASVKSQNLNTKNNENQFQFTECRVENMAGMYCSSFSFCHWLADYAHLMFSWTLPNTYIQRARDEHFWRAACVYVYVFASTQLSNEAVTLVCSVSVSRAQSAYKNTHRYAYVIHKTHTRQAAFVRMCSGKNQRAFSKGAHRTNGCGRTLDVMNAPK